MPAPPMGEQWIEPRIVTEMKRASNLRGCCEDLRLGYSGGMIRMSSAQIKMTVGVGALCQAGLLASAFDRWGPRAGGVAAWWEVWVMVVLVVVPVGVFVFFRQGEVRERVLRPVLVGASVWHLAVSLAGVLAYGMRVGWAGHEGAWMLFGGGLLVGAIPCLVVIYRAFGVDRVRSAE